MPSPIKSSFKTEWFSLCLILISLFVGFRLYHYFPAQVPSHWNIKGQVDAYSGPFSAAFTLPLMMVGLYLMFLVLPLIDPKKEQYASFSTAYHYMKDLIIGFLFALYLMLCVNGLGHRIDIGFYLPVMVGVLFVAIGIILNKIKMNWFMGIRTPWTMSSEEVWNKTHQMSSRVLILAGILMGASAFVTPSIKIILFILAIAVVVFALPIYSYLLYRKIKQARTNK